MSARFEFGFKESCFIGDAITQEIDGFTIRARLEHDDDMEPPWQRCDGHGQVSDWTTRDKHPGEVVLIEDGQSKRYYDFA